MSESRRDSKASNSSTCRNSDTEPAPTFAVDNEAVVIDSDNDQFESIAPTLEIPENILPLKEPSKVAAEFSKFFEERTGRQPFSYFSSGIEQYQRPSASNIPIGPDSILSRPSSPMSVKAGISPQEDMKMKSELLELNVPGKLTFEKPSLASSKLVATDHHHKPQQQESFEEPFSEQDFNEDKQSVISQNSTTRPKGWIAPESWAVIPPLSTSEIPQRPLSNEASSSELSAIRIYKIETKAHRTASLVNMLDSFFQPSVLLACPLNTTALEICATLTQKYFTSYDSSRYRLYVTHGGIERMLAKDDYPLLLQQSWLKEIGYTEADELSKLGQDDHSYLFRFVFREVPVKNKVLNEEAALQEDQSVARKSKITQRTAHLADENLSVIPVALYKNATTLESLDLSRNTLLDLPEDFFEMLRSLRILVLKSNSLYSIPPALFQLARLTHLNLSQNYLNSQSVQYLSCLTNLTNLDLSCNQLESLPGPLASLKNLLALNVSTNRFTLFPPVIFEFRNLKDLNLSFNSIAAIPDGIDSLQNLRTIFITGNSLTYISPKISSLKHLKLLDVRGNLLQEVSGISALPSLTELQAQNNSIARFSDLAWKYMAILQLESNGLTSLNFSQGLMNVKVVNLSSCKIAGLPNDFFTFLPNIHTVQLDRNQLTALPESVNSAAWLENLSVSDNLLNDAQLNFSRLTNLKRLDLHGNNLKTISSRVWSASALVSLNLSSNFLTEFPDSPMSFEDHPLALSLTELYLADNRLKTESLMNFNGLTRLTVLNLSGNEIVDLEENLNEMHRLVELYISDNAITSLPDDIGKWGNLKILHLNGNRFMTLPFDLCRNTALEVLDVSGNNLKYNITNYPYDWNWAWNLELRSLNLSDNRRFEIRPDRKNVLPAGVVAPAGSGVNSLIFSSNNPNSSTPNKTAERSLVDFRNLAKLRFLNVAQVNIAPESVPVETTSLRVRQHWHAGDSPKVGLAQWCGRTGEFDTFDVICKRFLGDPGHHVIALFSGRHESLVSLQLYDTFIFDLEAEIIRVGGLEAFKIGDGADVDSNLKTALFGNVLRRTFLNCNRRLSSQPTPVRAGSTATVLYLLNRVAWVANVGDSMAVMSREGQAITLSSRHYPGSRGEIERIRELGGFVSSNGLVAGELDICRAFGYFHLLPHVNANPAISATPLSDRDEFIILASHELWKFISYQMAVDLVRQNVHDLTRGAYKLRDLAISYGAAHSITVVCVDLRGLLAFAATSPSIEPSEPNASPNPSVFGNPLSSRPSKVSKEHQIADQGLARLEKEIDPPTGEVALVFTDIKDSTTLWELYPAPMHVALRMHNTIMRRSLRRIGGYEVKNDGDSFMASFPSIVSALKWTLTVQKELLEADWPQEIVDSPIAPTIASLMDGRMLFRGLSVRMGLHVGEPFCEIHSVTERMDYTGPMVNFTARVGSAPTGGQIFVTPQVIAQYAKLSSGQKDDIGSLVVFDMGMMKFKGVEKPERLFSVYPAGLAARHEILQHEKADPYVIEE